MDLNGPNLKKLKECFPAAEWTWENDQQTWEGNLAALVTIYLVDDRVAMVAYWRDTTKREEVFILDERPCPGFTENGTPIPYGVEAVYNCVKKILMNRSNSGRDGLRALRTLATIRTPLEEIPF